jgi:GTP cyclohydrolase II
VSETPPTLQLFARASLPTRWGAFTVVSFAKPDGETIDDVALIKGDVAGAMDVPTRVHSECVTGDVFGSVRCDCRDQLERALGELVAQPVGVLLYMRQEGRGIGIAHKVRAYALQDDGLDTLEADRHLGFDGDLRRYDGAAAMLAALQVASIRLFTNNPAKVDGLRAAGIVVTERVPLVVAPRPENLGYLTTKKTKMGHTL